LYPPLRSTRHHVTLHLLCKLSNAVTPRPHAIKSSIPTCNVQLQFLRFQRNAILQSEDLHMKTVLPPHNSASISTVSLCRCCCITYTYRARLTLEYPSSASWKSSNMPAEQSPISLLSLASGNHPLIFSIREEFDGWVDKN